jgi:serine/threonine protein kinase
LEAKEEEIPMIPFISHQSISNITSIKTDFYEGTYNNKNVLLVEKKIFPIQKYSPLIFQDYNSYFLLKNPAFPKLIGQTSLEKAFIILDKPQGRTLLELFDQDRMQSNMISSFENYKLIIALKIIEAVEDIHNSKMVLAYMNPETIIVSSNFDVFFTGICNNLNTSSVYSSPSLLLNDNQSNLDYGVDIWSLGCLFYFIFSGHHPFNSDREIAINYIKNKKDFLFDDIKINSKIKELIKMCCNLKNQDKITSIHSMKLFFIISHQSFFKINFKGVLNKKGGIMDIK